MSAYTVNEIFYSLQGEGVRVGTPNLFLRFAGCNQACRVKTHGFDCDTEFATGRTLTLDEIVAELDVALSATCGINAGARVLSRTNPPEERPAQGAAVTGGDSSLITSPLSTQHLALGTLWVVLTGGEPALQVDRELIDRLHKEGYSLAIETNGTIELPDGIDWITVSPKVAEHAIRQRRADEVKYVRAQGQSIPRTVVQAEHKLISPAFSGDTLDPRTLEWCLRLVQEQPDWRLSVQQHKLWRIR